MSCHPHPRCRGALALGVLLALGASGAEPLPSPALPAPTAPPPADVPAGTVVTATRLPRPVRDVPATVTVLPREEMERSPALTVDTLVRTLPSVATFRRTSSLVSDPSAQGLNLRGLGPSGVSRGLVLLDGVPVNDPFGGWVYWRALPRLGLERVEVVPGGGSALYGSAALGGVVQLFSSPVERDTVQADASYGMHRTALLAARAARRSGDVGVALEGELLTSGGHPVVAPLQRGAIDAAAPSTHGTLQASLEARAGERLHLRGRVGLFRERQNGGTTFTTARVDLGHAALAAQLEAGRAGTLELTLFGRLQRFGQQRARVSEGRASEVLGAEQEVPSDEEGLSLVWTARPLTLLGSHVLSAGADARRVDGTSREELFPAGPGPTSVVRRDAGGEQRFVGLFLQDLYSVTRWLEASAALRLDGWRNRAGERRVERADGSVEQAAFAARDHLQLSPRVGLLVRARDWLALRASGWRAFRAPTLNELYRPFQVGTVLTSANEGLRPESLWGAEAGLEASSRSGLVARATGFWNWLEEPITNVTLAAPLPDGARRQRQNLGAARVRGLEVGVEGRLARRLTALLAYTYVDSQVMGAPGQPELVGKQLAQDPAHRGSAQLRFDDPALLSATLQARVVGPQYEDDLNTLGMGGYVLVDAFVSRRLFWQVDGFAAVENLFGREYLVGRAGVDTVGQPFLARVGLRLRAQP